MRFRFFFLIGSFCLLSAQEIKGVVYDAASRKPLEGVTVLNQRTQRGMSSTSQGHFSLEGSPGDVFQFRLLGYKIDNFTIPKGISSSVSIYLEKETQLLEEVVITGTQTEHQSKDAPVYTRVISKNEIRQTGIKSLAALLETSVAGLTFTTHAGVPNISLQGLDAKYILILIDGNRISGETHNNIDFDAIDIDQIERIEIVKGVSSSLYGSNAMGGVINLITRKTTKDQSVDISSTYDNLHKWRQRQSLQLRYKKLRSYTSFIYQQNRSYWLDDQDLVTRYYPDKVETDKELNRWEVEAEKIYNANQSFIYSLSDLWKFRIDANLYQRKKNNSERNKGSVLDTYFYNHSIRSLVEGSFLPGHRIVFEYNYSHYRKAEYYKRLSQQEEVYSNPIHELKATSSYRINDFWNISSGASFFSEGLKTYMFRDEGFSSAKSMSVFAQSEFKFKKWTSVAGIRWDYHSLFGSNFSPKLSVLYQPFEQWRWRFSYGKGFRSPSLKELFTDWDHLGMFRIVGNPDLKPEVNHNFSTQISYDTASLHLSAEAFYNAISQKITTRANIQGDTLFYRNLERQTLKGIELQMKYRLNRSLHLQAGLQWVNDGGYENGYKVTGTRPFDALLSGTYSFNTKKILHSLSLMGRYWAPMQVYSYDSSVSQYYHQNYEGYQIWRFNYSIELNRWAEISLLVDNLMDYKPKIYDFYSGSSPGRVYQIHLALHFDKLLNH